MKVGLGVISLGLNFIRLVFFKASYFIQNQKLVEADHF